MKCVCYDEAMQVAAASRTGYCVPPERLTAEHWWTAFLSSLQELGKAIPLKDIICVSFSGYNAMVGVDKSFRGITPVITYSDTRPAEFVEKRDGSGDFEYIFRKTANRLYANGIMANSIVFLEKSYPGLPIDRYLYSSGYIAARLTGRAVIDTTRASLSLLFDPLSAGAPEWDADLLAYFGISPDRLPELLSPSDTVGRIHREAAHLTGLSEGTTVLAGAMDSVCASLGCGVIKSGQLLDIGGSAGGMAALSRQPQGFRNLYTVRAILPEHYIHIGPLDMSGSLFTWYVEHFLPGSNVDDYFRQMDILPPLSPRVLFLPYVGGARHPFWSSDTCGHFVDIQKDCTLDDFSRAVMDGLGCAYRRICDDFRKLGLSPREIIAGGGDSRSHAWLQTKANFLQIPYAVSPEREASAKGCAIIAAVKEGILDSYEASAAAIKQSAYIRPEPEHAAAYQDYYLHFQQRCAILYPPEKNEQR